MNKTPDIRALRKFAKTQNVNVYSQGKDWVSAVWNDFYGAYMVKQLHYSVVTEKQALLEALRM